MQVDQQIFAHKRTPKAKEAYLRSVLEVSSE